MGGKNLCVTYFLWISFGWTGIHHFYLGRDKQAFVWWSTCGGFFFGWLRDLWRIPMYVDEANEEEEFMENFKRRMKMRKAPPFNITRFLGELWVGYFYGLLVRIALPEETPTIITTLLITLGLTIGVYMVGSIGCEKGSFYKTWMATILSFICFRYIQGDDISYMYVSLVSACAFNYYRSYKPMDRKSGNIFTRFSRLCFGASIIFFLFTSFLYFNAAITYKDGEKVRLRDAVNHFFKSPAWLDFKNTIWQIYEQVKTEGWTNFYFEVLKAFDPTGEANALKVLELPKDASEEDIRRAYKKLVVKWHPDRCKGEHCKNADEKFMEIQQAYEILSKRKKGSKSRREKERTEF